MTLAGSAGLQLSPGVMRPEENISFCLGIPFRVHNLRGPPSALADSTSKQPWPRSLQCRVPEILHPACWSRPGPLHPPAALSLVQGASGCTCSHPPSPVPMACAGRLTSQRAIGHCGVWGPSCPGVAPPQSSSSQTRRARSLGCAALDLESGALRRNHSLFKPRRGNGQILPCRRRLSFPLCKRVGGGGPSRYSRPFAAPGLKSCTKFAFPSGVLLGIPGLPTAGASQADSQATVTAPQRPTSGCRRPQRRRLFAHALGARPAGICSPSVRWLGSEGGMMGARRLHFPGCAPPATRRGWGGTGRDNPGAGPTGRGRRGGAGAPRVCGEAAGGRRCARSR